MGYLDQVVQDIYVVDVNNSDVTRLTEDDANNAAPQWSPDGKTILFAANMFPDSFRPFRSHLRTVCLDCELEELLGKWGGIGAATWTPDGEKVVFIGRPDDGKPIGTKFDLFTIDVETGDIQNRTEGLTVGVGGSLSADMPILLMPIIFISDDSQTAYVQVQAGGTVQIYRVALTDAEAFESVVGGERACHPRDMNGDQMLFMGDDFTSTSNLFLTSVNGGEEKQLTDMNADFFANIDLPTHERLLFNGTDGVQVEGWYLKPAIGEAPYPTIMYIHGGPHAGYGYRFHFDMANAGRGGIWRTAYQSACIYGLWRRVLHRHQRRLGQPGLW
jgi:dipeptidyl aminopeptidase/acylaminoacyl peptidase